MSKNNKTASTPDMIHQHAFEHSFQASIITNAHTGKIIVSNIAACKLLGYTTKQLLTKSRSSIFDIKESGFKKMLKQRTAEGRSEATVTAIKKDGTRIPCEISSAVFMGEDGIEKAITTISDRSQHILHQKDIDNKKEKIVADDIVLAKAKQKKLDAKKKKIVAGDIVLAKAKSNARLEENNEWIKYIARSSYDVMWDWDITTGEIYVGDSVAEVFGYIVEKNSITFNGFSKCLLPEEKDAVEKRLLKTQNSHKKIWNDAFKLQRRDGSVASTISRASVVRDETGKAIRMIGAIQDISKLQELEVKLKNQITLHKEESEKFYLAAKLSFDVIWDWNVLTGEVFIGEGYEDLYGYTIKNNQGNFINDWKNYLHPDDKESVVSGIEDALASGELMWEQAYRFTRADGSTARIFNRASIIRDARGKAYRMIGAMQDISRQKEMEQKLDDQIAAQEKIIAEYESGFNIAFNLSSDVLFDSDLETDKLIVSNGYEKEFGYEITNNMTTQEDWVSRIHPDDKEPVTQDRIRMLASEEKEWKCTYRFLKSDGTVINVLSKAVVLRKEDGKAYRMIGSLHDVSTQKMLEEMLEQEINMKEKQIAEATADAKDTERSDIGKELHDNINQLLAASKMYIDMAKRGGANSQMYLSRSSEYTLNAIEEIRKLTKGLTADTIKNIGLCEAIENISHDTMQVSPVKISCDMDSFVEYSVNEKFKLNVFRIVQEQLNNILKHAGATEVNIRLSQNNRTIILTVTDNGIGFDTQKKITGIGLSNIKSRAAVYNGKAEVTSQPSSGCRLSVTFPVTEMQLSIN